MRKLTFSFLMLILALISIGCQPQPKAEPPTSVNIPVEPTPVITEETQTTATPEDSLLSLDEEIVFQNGDITLAGTLTLPATGGPHPAVIMISGSGLQDRNNANAVLPGYEPFLWIADHLARSGVAVLRYDDRGVGESKGGTMWVDTSFDYADDVEAALEYLVGRPEINPEQIGLLGHSEGSFIASIVTARNPNVAFAVSMAGYAVRGSDLMTLQTELGARDDGLSEEEVQRVLADNQKEIELITAKDWDNLEVHLYELLVKELGSLPEEQRPPGDELERVAREQAASNMDSMKGWFYVFVTENPADYWQKTKVPVLALFGGKDIQVHSEQNMPAMQAALDKAGNKDSLVFLFPNANHLFLEQPGEASTDAADLKMELALGVLETITQWVVDQTVSKNQ